MDEKLILAKRIGNFVSNIILGETKEIIIRTDEKVKGISMVVDRVQTDIRDVRKDIDDLKDKVGDLREEFFVVEDRVEVLWREKLAPTNSPRQLNDHGKNILNESGIKAIIESKKDQLLAAVREKNPGNAYDAEQAIFSIAAELPKRDPQILEKLKEGAFRVGQSIDAVLFVGGVYLRDLIFEDLGFSMPALNEPKKDP